MPAPAAAEINVPQTGVSRKDAHLNNHHFKNLMQPSYSAAPHIKQQSASALPAKEGKIEK